MYQWGLWIMITVFILTIHMNSLTATYGYKFLNRKNCDKIGRELSVIKKKWKYSCVPKKVKNI